MPEKISVVFIEPMLALAVTKLPEGPAWTYELKFDGYRALGLKAIGQGPTPLAQRQRLHKAFRRDRGGTRKPA